MAHPDALDLSIRQVLPYLQQPAPELRTLFSSYANSDLFLEEIFIHPLFSGVPPNLKHILHHRLSDDFRELHCPLFHNLSELYLSLHDSMDVNFRLFLDLLALSPCLRLLHVHIDIDYNTYIRAFVEDFTGHKITLPYMQRLILEVDSTAELVTLILEHITLPSNLKWHITSQYDPQFDASPALIQRLSQARFTYQHIQLGCEDFSVSLFEELPGPEHINLINHNKLVYLYGNPSHVEDFWDTLMHSIESSRITRLHIEFLDWLDSGYCETLSKIMTNLEILDITENATFWNYKSECILYCLAALTPLLNPKLEVPIDIDYSFTVPRPFPCPFLREMTINVEDYLWEVQAIMLRECSDKRREEGYPVQMLVRCPEMDEGVESMLQLKGNDAIRVETVPS